MATTAPAEATADRTVPDWEGHRHGSGGYLRVTAALFAAGLTTFISMYCPQAMLPEISAAFRVTPATAALSVSATTGCLALAVIPASALSERFGRPRVMLISAVLSGVIGLLLAFAPNMPALLAGRALQGVALAGVPAVAMAYLAEEVHAGSLGAAMGRYIAGTTIGGLCGRLVPAFVFDLVPADSPLAPWRLGLLAAEATALLSAFVFAWALPSSRRFTPKRVSPAGTAKALSRHLRTLPLLRMFLIGFLLMGGFVTVYNYLGYRLAAPPYQLPQTVTGLIFLLYLIGTWTSGAAGRTADRIGRRNTLVTAVVVAGIGLALTAASPLWLVILGMGLFTGGFFAGHATASAWVGALAGQDRAEAAALYLFNYYVGGSVAGAVGGLVFAAWGWTGICVFVGALLALSCLVGVAQRR